MSSESTPRTFAHQGDLPRLPVPDVVDTLARWLKSVRPLVDEDQWAEAERLAQDFARPGGVGEALNAQLRRRAADRADSSWLVDWWREFAYLRPRCPLPINVSYFFQFKPSETEFGNDHCTYAAALLTATEDVRQSLVNETYPVDRMGRDGKPICMHMYRHHFNACRIPKPQRDDYATFDPSQHTHVAVMRKNHFYSLNLWAQDRNGSPRRLSTPEIASQLQSIVLAAGQVRAPPVGVLTAQDRDTWASVRARQPSPFARYAARKGAFTAAYLCCAPMGQDYATLRGSEGGPNAAALDRLASASLLLCLDDAAPRTEAEMGRLLLHGSPHDRWWDKTMQLVVTDSGRAGVIGEHALSDGMPTATWCHAMLAALEGGRVDHGDRNEGASLPAPQALPLELPEATHRAIARATAAHVDTVARHDLRCEDYTTYGKNAVKAIGVSPDAWCQLALQLAYYRLHGRFTGTYEAAQTRQFLHGRTETLRSCSRESATWARSMEDSGVPAAERWRLLRAAAARHSGLIREAVAGRGVDRHLFGLQRCVEEGEDMHPLFSCAAFTESCTWRMSTSTLTSPYFENWGWGQVVPDGYGVAYMALPAHLHFNVVSECMGSRRLLAAVRRALDDMMALAQREARSDGAPRARL